MEFDAYMGRHLFRTTRTETYQLDRGSRMVSLRGAPVIQGRGAITLKFSTTRSFDDADALDSALWELDPDAGYVLLFFDHSYDDSWIEITYDGGMALDTASFVDAYPDIAGVGDLEVINRLNRSETPQGSGQGQSGVVVQERDWNLLDGTRRVLDRYSKEVLGGIA